MRNENFDGDVTLDFDGFTDYPVIHMFYCECTLLFNSTVSRF